MKLTKKQRQKIYLEIAKNLRANDYDNRILVCIDLAARVKCVISEVTNCFPELKLFNDGGDNSSAFLSSSSWKLEKTRVYDMKNKEIVMLLCAEMCND